MNLTREAPRLGLSSALFAAMLLAGACTEERIIERGNGDDDGGSGAVSSDGQDEVGGDQLQEGSEPGGPEIRELTTSEVSITEGDIVRFDALVTDPDGLEDIAGGRLLSPDGTTKYGVFVQLSLGSFEIVLSWNDIHDREAINFAADSERVFRAEFTDNSGKKSFREIKLPLSCEGGPACDGSCCPAGLECGPENQCMSACLPLTEVTHCAAYCEDRGASCIECSDKLGEEVMTYSDSACTMIDTKMGPSCYQTLKGLDYYDVRAVRCCCE